MSDFQLKQVQKQTQSLVMAPQMRQSLKILQVSALELRDTILEELQTNPTLEEESSSISFEDRTQEVNTPKDNADELSLDSFEVFKKLDDDWKEYFGDENTQLGFNQEDANRRQHFFDSLVSETSLQEHIIEQVKLADCDDALKAAIPYIIGSLDDRGFLGSTPSEIAELAEIDPKTVEDALHLLKSLDPPGIGSKSVEDCLLHQLSMQGASESLAATIIKDHFKLLLRKRIPDLARKLSVSVQEVQEAVQVIATLDPAPGRRFTEDTNRSVSADITIFKDDEKWVIQLNSDYIPRLRINPTYKKMLGNPDLTKKEKEYLRMKMQSSKFLISSIGQRQETIQKIADRILELQKDFFEHGVSKLKPLTMSHVADIIGVHETTVSRATSNKYVQTPHGLFEMKYFFTSGYENSSGESVANTSIKEEIANIISGEDPEKPYSDQKVADILTEKGTKIARRTVAKYREELGILPTNLRREY